MNWEDWEERRKFGDWKYMATNFDEIYVRMNNWLQNDQNTTFTLKREEVVELVNTHRGLLLK